MCLENSFSYYRGKVDAQLSMVRMPWEKPCFSGPLLMCPVSQLSFSPLHVIQLSCFGSIYGVPALQQPLGFLSDSLQWTPQDCTLFWPMTDSTPIMPREPGQKCIGLFFLSHVRMLWPAGQLPYFPQCVWDCLGNPRVFCQRELVLAIHPSP